MRHELRESADRSGWPRLPAEVAFMSGMTDVIGWLTLGGFFSANITGDLVQAVSYAVPGHAPHSLQLIAVPVFFGAVVLVYLLVRRLERASASLVRSLLLSQFVLLACASVVSGAGWPAALPDATRHVLVGVIAVLVIGVANVTMHLLDEHAATTWALTANAVTAAVALLDVVFKHGSAAARARNLERLRSIWPVMVAFLLGVLAGTAAGALLGRWAWAAPTAAALAMLVASPRSGHGPRCTSAPSSVTRAIPVTSTRPV